MGVAMKNNNEAAAFHVDDYDMVVNEECWINGNCNNYVRMRITSHTFTFYITGNAVRSCEFSVGVIARSSTG